MERPQHSHTNTESAIVRFASALQAGHVYRREDLSYASNAIDRHLRELLEAGRLKKLAQGLYYVPRKSAFGELPPDDHALVAAFLRDKDFLMFSPASYHTLGLGTTQLHNRTWVYNHKRHGIFTFGNRQFDFRMKHRFPKKLTPEFLFVDMLSNLNDLAEDSEQVLARAQLKMGQFDRLKLEHALEKFGTVATQKRVKGWLHG